MSCVRIALAGVLGTFAWANGIAGAEAPDVVAPELATSLKATTELEQGWQAPPQLARVRCWWWWLNGNVTKEAITRDLEAMRANGMGGANIIDAAHASSGQHQKPPHGPDFASPEWKELFVHALKEAERLDLELGLNIQSGWNLGGPTVTRDQAAKMLTWSEQTVSGGERQSVRLRKPRDRDDYYRDLWVIAFPLPENRRQAIAEIDNFRQKAYYEYPGGFTAVDASHLLEIGDGDDGEHTVSPEDIHDLSDRLDDGGRLTWEVPPGQWRILRIGYTLSGAHVSTSSDNWNGYAIDYMDPTAFDKYCADVLTPLLDAAGAYVGRSLRFVHTDSWELGPVNWTPAMPAEFQDRRGYAMTRYLPALAGYVVEDRETSNRFLNDFRRTIAELIADGKYRAFSQYAHPRGLGIHPESGGPHAAPVDALLCLGRSDIPMGEFWARSQTHRVNDHQRLFVKQPASAAHVYGRRLVMAEAFTTIGPHWEKDPRDLKPVFDRVACEGLNLLMWHTFDCSPAEQGIPGQAYFAGTHLNPQVTWWNQADGFIHYINRCQFLLQQGLPVSDVLYFYGENVPSFARLKRDDPAGVLPGFDYDVANAEVLAQRTNVEDGQIVLPDGTRYAALVLPPPGHYGLDSLEHVARLVDAGATVIGHRPATPIGLLSAEDEGQFHQLAEHLWNGRVVDAAQFREVADELGLVPDFAYDRNDDAHLDYIHRRTDKADIYFVVNRRNQEQEVRCSFRVTDRQVELWDPVTGHRSAAADFEQTDDGTVLPLRLAPNGSVFVVFRRGDAAAAPTPQRSNWIDPQVLDEIAGPWRVTFDPNWGGPDSVEFNALTDWSESDDPRIRHYSGTATYHNDFDILEDAPRARRYWLDLGEVKNLARVRLNGVDLGVAWTVPFRVELTSAIRPGSNDLQIDVVNLWPNRLIRDATLPPDERLTKTNIQRFDGDDPLLPSGLLGPVQLLVEEPQ